jgi:hypothetical protein
MGKGGCLEGRNFALLVSIREPWSFAWTLTFRLYQGAEKKSEADYTELPRIPINTSSFCPYPSNNSSAQ